ncbi:MAG: ATP-dependent Clp protease adaptor ClpS [Phycisphaeraceae bacterium]|nr:ATP-dependent Clp protease adaptor ClpS [Phycisphaeraceae bacterium]
MSESNDKSQAPDADDRRSNADPGNAGPSSTTASDTGGGGTSTKTKPGKPTPKVLPPWKVLLHNDDVNSMEDVIQTIIMLTPLSEQDALKRTLEAHEQGIALLLTTHKERAELYQDQFTSRKLTVTIEPAEA